MYDAIELKLIEEADLLAQDAHIDECPLLKKIDQIWRSIKGVNRFPLRQDFSLAQLGSEVNWIVLAEMVGQNPDDFIVRLQSTNTADVAGNISGQTFAELPTYYRRNCIGLYDKIRHVQGPVVTRTEVLHPEKISISVYCWGAPLSRNGSDLDYIILRPHFFTSSV